MVLRLQPRRALEVQLNLQARGRCRRPWLKRRHLEIAPIAKANLARDLPERFRVLFLSLHSMTPKMDEDRLPSRRTHLTPDQEGLTERLIEASSR